MINLDALIYLKWKVTETETQFNYSHSNKPPIHLYKFPSNWTTRFFTFNILCL